MRHKRALGPPTSDGNETGNKVFLGENCVIVLQMESGDNMAAAVTSPPSLSIALRLHKLSGIRFGCSRCSVSTT